MWWTSAKHRRLGTCWPSSGARHSLSGDRNLRRILSSAIHWNLKEAEDSWMRLDDSDNDIKRCTKHSIASFACFIIFIAQLCLGNWDLWSESILATTSLFSFSTEASENLKRSGKCQAEWFLRVSHQDPSLTSRSSQWDMSLLKSFHSNFTAWAWAAWDYNSLRLDKCISIHLFETC